MGDFFRSLFGKGPSSTAEIKVNMSGRSYFVTDLSSLHKSKVVRRQAEAAKKIVTNS